MPRSMSIWIIVATVMLAGVGAAQVRERATEEILPGIRVRSHGDVVIDAGSQGCKPACGAKQVCRYHCRDAACEAGTPLGAKCGRCEWRCVE
jgi:hypothetical protein